MQQVLARRNVQKTKFEAAEMIVDPWNKQYPTFPKFYDTGCFIKCVNWIRNVSSSK